MFLLSKHENNAISLEISVNKACLLLLSNLSIYISDSFLRKSLAQVSHFTTLLLLTRHVLDFIFILIVFDIYLLDFHFNVYLLYVAYVNYIIKRIWYGIVLPQVPHDTKIESWNTKVASLNGGWLVMAIHPSDWPITVHCMRQKTFRVRVCSICKSWLLKLQTASVYATSKSFFLKMAFESDLRNLLLLTLHNTFSYTAGIVVVGEGKEWW